MREQLAELVAEGGHAGGLEAHHRSAARDLLAQLVQDLAQLACGQIEHAVVVERAPAAEPLRLDDHPEAGVLQHLHRRLRHFGMEEVVEGIGPEQNAG